MSEVSQRLELAISVGPKVTTRIFRSDVNWLQKVGSPFSVRPKLKIGWTEKLGFGRITEVVHLGGTEFAESVCPRLLMRVLSSESC